MELFHPSSQGDHYNYAAAGIVLRSSGDCVVFYCANPESGKFVDDVKFRVCDSSTGAWGEEQTALRPRAGMWDSQHCCDPEVVKGHFWKDGEEYRYCMFYLGESLEAGGRCKDNQIGAAFSKDDASLLRGEWAALDEPVVPFPQERQHWGVGQPSATTVGWLTESRAAWRVLLLYTQGDGSGTGIRRVVLTFRSDAASGQPVHTEGARVTSAGLAGTFHNASFAYVPRERLPAALRPSGEPTAFFYAVREGKPRPDGCSIASFVEVVRITDAGLWGAADARWEHVLSIREDLTGFPFNHNGGFLRDEAGMCLPSGRLDLLFSVARHCGCKEWTYRIWGVEDILRGGMFRHFPLA